MQILLIILIFVSGLLYWSFLNKPRMPVIGSAETANYIIIDQDQLNQIYKSDYIQDFDALQNKFNYLIDLYTIRHRYEKFHLYLFRDDKQKLIGLCIMAQMISMTLTDILVLLPEFDETSKFYKNLTKYQPLFIDFISFTDKIVLTKIKNVLQNEPNYIFWLDNTFKEYVPLINADDKDIINTKYFTFVTNFTQKHKKIIDIEKPLLTKIEIVDNYIHFKSSQVYDFIYSFGLDNFNELNKLLKEIMIFPVTFYKLIKGYNMFDTVLLVKDNEYIGIINFLDLKNNDSPFYKSFSQAHDFEERVLWHDPIYIFTFHIKPKYHGYGYALKLFNIARNLVKGRFLIVSVNKLSKELISIYKNLGFEDISVEHEKFRIMALF